MLQLLYQSLMTNLSTLPFFKFIVTLKETYYFTYLFTACPAACGPVTSSRSWGTVGHLARPSTECSWQHNSHNWRVESASLHLHRGQVGYFGQLLWQYAKWVSGHWSSEAIFQICTMNFSNRLTIHNVIIKVRHIQLCHQGLVEQLRHL